MSRYAWRAVVKQADAWMGSAGKLHCVDFSNYKALPADFANCSEKGRLITAKLRYVCVLKRKKKNSDQRARG